MSYYKTKLASKKPDLWPVVSTLVASRLHLCKWMTDRGAPTLGKLLPQVEEFRYLVVVSIS